MLKKKYLILKGCAGLGNRLLTVCAAAEYAEKSDRILLVDWKDGQFGIKGENVFYNNFELSGIEHIKNLQEIPFIETLSISPKSWKQKLHLGIYESFEFHTSGINIFLNKLVHKVNVKGDLAKLKGYWKLRNSYQYKSSLSNTLCALFDPSCYPAGSDYSNTIGADIVVFADFAPKVSRNTFLKFIKLKPEIQELVSQFAITHSLNNNVVGVHIRATDKKPSVELIKLFSKIEALGLVEPVIFLATDSKDVAQAFSIKFSKVITFADRLPEVPVGLGVHQLGLKLGNSQISEEVFKQSVMDMWLLAECEYLFYQGNSTFSLISNFLHRRPDKVSDWLKA